MKKLLLALAAVCLMAAGPPIPSVGPGDAASVQAAITAVHNGAIVFPNSVYYAKTYGSCTWDSTHDVSPCIQAAINDVVATTTIANGGAVVVLPSGTYGISSTLNWSVPNVSLAGAGVGNVYGNNLTANSATILRWIGASHSTMLSIAPPSSGGNPISNDNVTGILFNCNGGLADIGFQELSVSKSTFDIGYQQCGTNGAIFDVQSNMAKFSDTQQNQIWVQGYDDLDGTIGVQAAGTGSGGANFGNTSENDFHLIRVSYKNGDGVHFDNTDHNQIDMFLGSLVPTGTGNAWVWNGSNDPNNGQARYNTMTYAAYGGTMVSKGTGAFTNPAFKNWITRLAIAQNGTTPTIEAGSVLCISGADSQMITGGCLGTGSGTTAFSPLQAQVATSDVNGGNARGANATDFQMLRTNAAQVASGQSGTIGGGESNTSSGIDSTVPGGLANIASSSYAVATGTGALADLIGVNCHASGTISSGRRSEVCQQTLKAVSAANTTPARLTADLLAAGTQNCVNFRLGGGVYNMRVQLSAIDTTTTTNFYGWTQAVDLLAMPTAAASTTLVTGTPVILASGTTSGIAITEAADTTNGCYSLQFTPPTSNTHVWDVSATVTWTRTD